MKQFKLLCLLFLSSLMFPQSNLDKLLKGGEIIVNGLSVLKHNKQNTPANNNSNPTVVESLCIKNKLQDKITFVLVGKDGKDNEVKKELVIPQGGKECTYNLAKGVWSYEIILANKETYKKGEYKLEDEITVTVE